ncbi:MAG: macrolide ABC transporter ATP-binding protein [Euryarchaeota archaeon]|nr:macrolide ABC transporter ATP-binding protein [Euryarchaeota archaeon]|tara:strand:+ start:310 stop:960 length:651 start_codon:yes stop_codon:yes gene_type:complete
MEKLVSLSEVVKSYSDTKVLTGVNLDIEKGDLIVLLGPSGSGKTTLLNLIAGIDTANSGEIVVLGKDLSDMTDLELTDYRRDSVGYIFQFYNLLPNLTVMENASLGLELKGEKLDYAKVILEKVGLEDKSLRFPAQLSGGEQQRVAIARAMAKNPSLIVADEPTGNLDKNNSEAVRNLFKEIASDSTIIIATHDNNYLEIADKAYELNEGKLIKIK